MKIERVSDTQLKLLLTSKDLNDRDLKISDIASNSAKAQKLFHDIMTTAISEFGFEADEAPIMIEAIPASDGITIIISKVTNDIGENVSLVPGALGSRKYSHSPKTLIANREHRSADAGISIFEFSSLDILAEAAFRLNKIYRGTNMIYKYKNNYYLIMHTDDLKNHIMISEIDIMLSEYGKKYTSNEISKYHLLEHGEPIIKADAVEILANL